MPQNQNQPLSMLQSPIFKHILFTRVHARIQILGLSFLAAIFGLMTPYFQKLFIDRLVGMTSRFEWAPLAGVGILTLIGAAFATTLIQQAFGIFANYIGTREAISIQKTLSHRLYEKMLLIKRDSPNSRPVGEVVAIYATDVPGATTLLEQTLPSGASILFPLIMAPIAVHYIYEIPMTVTLVTMVIVAILNSCLSWRQSRFFYYFKQLAGERTGLVNEWIQNIRALRILGWTDAFEARIINKRIEETANRVAMVTNGQTMNAVGSSVTFVVTISSLYALVQFKPTPSTPGELLSLLWILGVFLTKPFRQMPWIFVFYLDCVSSIRRLEGFLQVPEHREQDEAEWSKSGPIDEKPNQSLDITQGHSSPIPEACGITVENLNLEIKEKTLLSNISFQIQPGEFVAIVGEVGSGKSLLLSALMLDTAASFSRYDLGFESQLKLAPHLVREKLSYVGQDGFVMSATLRENILFDYVSNTGQDEKILDCLAAAQFNVANERLPAGLNTEIGERGVNLSGGQKQRVALARAAFFDRPIVLLDDCLSAVDVDTEQGLIQDLLCGVWRSRTRVLVTHRLSVLENVDRVLFLQNGRLMSIDTLDNLISHSKPFREFIASLERNESAELTGDVVLT